METNYSTYHSIERTRERRKLKNRRAAVNHIYHAVRQGKRAADFTSWERSYLENEGKDGCTAIAYDGFCYILSEQGQCVTVHALPSWFGKRKPFDGKKRIRHSKRYQKYHPDRRIAECLA